MQKNNHLINKIFTEKKIDGIFISNLKNIQYYSGFTGSSAYLLMTSKNKYFFTDNRYKIQCQKEVPHSFTFIFYQKKLLSEISKKIQKSKIKKLGVESKLTNYFILKELQKIAKVKLVDCTDELAIIRQFKTIDEIKNIKKALSCAEKSFLQIKKIIKPGIKEYDIAVELEYQMKKNGSGKIAFPIIAASGKNSALPHAQPGNKKLKENEFVIIDFGAKINGYCSDTTYTMNINNKNKLLTKAYNVVKESVRLAVDSIEINGQMNLIDQKIHDHIKENGFKDGLIHSIGHGVGLDIHESPVLIRNKKNIFKKGMVFTIEPGIYLENIGGVRIELMAYMSDKGLKILNSKHENWS